MMSVICETKNIKGLGWCNFMCWKHIGDEPFAVLLGDSITKSTKPCTKQLIDVFRKYKKPAISIREVSCDNVCSYRIVDGNKIDDEVYKIT